LRRAQNEFGLRIKKIRSDNGTEFKNSQIEGFLEEEGIKHEFSSPYTPQQNGVVERENRTLLDMARTMLDEYKTSDQFWAQAVNTACYAINRPGDVAGAPDCPVVHRTVRCTIRHQPPQTVLLVVVRCAIRHQPPQTVLLVVGAINTPQPPYFNASKFSAIKPLTRALDFIQRHNQRDQILSQVRNHSKQISD
jgi:transposase InsO family protein